MTLFSLSQQLANAGLPPADKLNEACPRSNRFYNPTAVGGRADLTARKRVPTSYAKQINALRDDPSRSIPRVVLDRRQRLIRLIERERRNARRDADLARQFEKIPGIRPRHIRHAANLPLAPQQPIVIELRNTIEMNRVDGHHSA